MSLFAEWRIDNRDSSGRLDLIETPVTEYLLRAGTRGGKFD
jgi:hypothetical protein